MREVSIEVSGKTEQDAIENALAQIGLERDDVSVEILERAKSGVLGFGGKRALVKVSYMSDQALETPTPTPTSGVVDVKEAKTEKVAKPAKAEKPAKEAVVQNKSVVAQEATDGQPAKRATTFLTGLLEKMEMSAEITIVEEGDILRIELSGENMGALIGRRGETLDAMQHLTSYAINHGAERRVRVFLDAENYRAKREETLIRLANKMADKVLRYRKNMGLEPMNAYERHIIHTALQEVEGISTYSAGAEPNRRVFVAYDKANAKRRPAREANATKETVVAETANVATEEKSYKEWA